MKTRRTAITLIVLALILLPLSAIHARQDEPPARAVFTSPWRGAVIEMCYADYAWGCADETGYPPPESFAYLRDLGANVVVIYTQHLWTLEPPYEPVEVEFERLAGAIDAAAAAGLPVVVGVRNGPGRNEMIPDYEEVWGEPLTAIYEDETAQGAYVAMLVDMIERFGERPEIIAWEPMIEPTPHTTFDPDETWEDGVLMEAEAWWHTFAARIITAMRTADPVRPIIIEPSLWGGPEAFAWMEPYDDDNLIYSVHTYAPYEYTHQFEPPYQVAYPGGIVWGEIIAPDWLDTSLDPVRDFQARHDVPILVGEWGGVRWVPNMAQYIRDQLALFEAEGWSWTIYAWSDQVWEVGGFEPIYGPDPDNDTPDPSNPVFAPILAAWALNDT